MIKDLTGLEIGGYKILKRASKEQKYYSYRWKCKCLTCGKIVYVLRQNILNPNNRSCGCLRRLKGNKNKNWKGTGQLGASYLHKLKSHAKRRNIDLDKNITTQFLWELFEKQNGLCALSGLKIEIKDNSKKDNIASLDRIDSSKGYTPNNVQWVHKDINYMKQKLTQEKFVELCSNICKYQEAIKKCEH